MKTGIKFKPCNVGTAKVHNRRDKKYLDAIVSKYGKSYIWSDRTNLNESWYNEAYSDTLPETLEQLKVLVKEKTGRAMQMKSHERVDRKTGKMKVIAGSSAIREGCPPINANSTVKDFDSFKEWLQSKGITVISINIHHDEGHIDDDTGEIRCNHHAHVIVDWIDHKTGKSIKLTKADCEEMQTILAMSLGMDRGTPKQDTGIEGLNAIEFKEKMAQQHFQELKQKNEQLEYINVDKQQLCQQLDSKIKAKADKANKENGSKIIRGGAAVGNTIANLFGKGKYADIESENVDMKQQVANIPEVVAQHVTIQTAQLKKERDRERELAELTRQEYYKLANNYNKLLQDMKNQEAAFKQRIFQRERTINVLKSRLQSLLDILGKLCRRAIDAILEFAMNAKARRFTFTQASAVNDYIKDGTDRETKGNTLMVLSRPFLSDEEYKKGEKEIENVVRDFPSYEKEKQEREAKVNIPRFHR